MILYRICFIAMMIGFLGVVLLSPDMKVKCLGLLYTIANGIIFFK